MSTWSTYSIGVWRVDVNKCSTGLSEDCVRIVIVTALFILTYNHRKEAGEYGFLRSFSVITKLEAVSGTLPCLDKLRPPLVW